MLKGTPATVPARNHLLVLHRMELRICFMYVPTFVCTHLLIMYVFEKNIDYKKYT